MKPIIYPYKRGLKSTAILRDIGHPIRYDTSRVRRGVALAWGMRTPPPWVDHVTWINNPNGIPIVANKLEWAATGLGPQSTTSIEIARQWAQYRGTKVMCRTILNGSGGAGIVVARNADEVIDAPLYTMYFRKQREYRIVYSPLSEQMYVASKRLQSNHDLDRDDLLIRTKDRGFVYQREHDSLPQCILDRLQDVSEVLSTQYGLNILGYDVAYNTLTDECCIIEANSAFGLNTESGMIVSQMLEDIGGKL